MTPNEFILLKQTNILFHLNEMLSLTKKKSFIWHPFSYSHYFHSSSIEYINKHLNFSEKKQTFLMVCEYVQTRYKNCIFDQKYYRDKFKDKTTNISIVFKNISSTYNTFKKN